jgi:hypothetical protein
VEIKATAWDRDGTVQRVVFKVDSTRIRVDKTAPYSAIWDTSLFAPGIHTVKAIAVDSDGNRRWTKINVTVVADDPIEPTGDPVEGEGTISAVGDGYIESDDLIVIYYTSTTAIQFNDVTGFATGLAVQYKGVLNADGSITASDLEIN